MGLSVTAISISILSLIGTMIFYFLQTKHNKKSVKPICAIFTTHYVNFISVRIENCGVGPLLIKNVECVQKKSDGSVTTSKTLFQLLPDTITKNEVHRILISGMERRPIPAGRRMYLLIVDLENNVDLRNEIRNILKTISITVEYTDIYGSRFEPEMLDLNLFENDYSTRLADIAQYPLWN